MKSSVLATIALATGFIALLYSACGKNNEKPAATMMLQESAKKEFQKIEMSYNAMVGIHKHLVSEHAGLIGTGNDSAHLHMEQEHLAFFHTYKEIVARHQLFVLHLDETEDSARLKENITAMQSDLIMIQQVMDKIKADHVVMTAAHQH